MDTRHKINKRKQREEEENKRQEEMKRKRTQFERKDKVIRPSDIVTVEEKMGLSDANQLHSSEEPAASSSSTGTSSTETRQSVVDILMKNVEQKDEEIKALEERLGEKDEENAGLRERLKKREMEFKKVQRKLKMENDGLRDNLQQSYGENQVLLEKLEQNEGGNKNLELEKKLEQVEGEKSILETKLNEAMAQIESETKTAQTAKLLADNAKQTVDSLKFQLEESRSLIAGKDADVRRLEESYAILTSKMVKMEELLRKKDTEIKSLHKEKNRKPSGSNNPRTEQISDDDCVIVDNIIRQQFKDVLKVFVQHQGKEDEMINWKKLLPILTACRLICKSWKESVDAIMQDDPSHHNIIGNKYTLGNYKRNFTPSPMEFYSRGKENLKNLSLANIEKRLRYDQSINLDYNPIPTRHLMIDHFGVKEWMSESHSELVMKFVQHFGHQVWYLSLSVIIQEPISFDDAYKIDKWFHDILWLLPNTRSLSINISYYNMPKYQAQELQNCEEIYRGYYAKWEYLTTLQFMTGRNGRFCHRIISGNMSRIQRFSFDSRGMKDSFWDFTFPRLQELKCYIEGGEAWQKFVKQGWKLERLTLDINRSWVHDKEITGISKDLGKLDETLKFLTISLPYAEERWFINDKLKLSHLESLHIRSGSGVWEPKKLEKLLCQLSSLETFNLEQIQTTDSLLCVFQRKSFVDYINNFLSQTDWKKFQCLKHVRLTVEINQKRVGQSFHTEVKRPNNKLLKLDLVRIVEEELRNLCTNADSDTD